MTLTRSEAEKLVRDLLKLHCGVTNSASCLVCELCNALLSGDMRREIENAAYRHVADEIVIVVNIPNDVSVSENGLFQRAVSLTTRAYQNRVRSLIQPPAQKEDGK